MATKKKYKKYYVEALTKETPLGRYYKSVRGPFTTRAKAEEEMRKIAYYQCFGSYKRYGENLGRLRVTV